MPVTIGSRLDAYEVIAPLGRGGMGEVWLARDLKLERKVALKVLPPDFTQDSTRVARFRQEARAASGLNHPNVCTIHSLGETPDRQQFIAMEYVEGATLRERLGGHHLTLRQVLDTAVQIASALSAAHAAGVVHRDLKPENVMLRPDGLVKVLDFGLAKLAPLGATLTGEDATHTVVRTDAGSVVGTTAYMSPEQARGQDVDARTDIWSLGVMLYEMVAGRRPFSGQSSGDVVAAILDREPALLARIEPDAPPELHRIVGKTLRKDKDQRYQVMKDLRLDLEALRDDVAAQARSSSLEYESTRPVATPTPTPAPTAANTARPSSAEYVVTQLARHKVRTALFALVLALIAGVAWWAGHGGSAPEEGAQNATPVQRTLTRVTFDEGLQAEPTWSPDGRFFAYSSNRNGNFDIWVQSGTEGNPVRVTSSPAHDWQPDWSPDGSRIVFRSERDGGGLFVVPALGGNERKLTAFGYGPRWSRDGSQVLFYSSILQTGFEPTNLYLVGLDGQPPRELLPTLIRQFTFPYVRAAWHPDGRRISIWGRHREWGWSLWTVPLTGEAPVKSALSAEVERQVKEAAVEFSDFLWAPSADAVYFVGLSRGVTNLWKVAVEPLSLRWIAGPERLTTSAGLDTDIALSPDGHKLAFTSRTEQSRIWSIPFDAAIGRTTGSGHPATAAGADAIMPTLTSDGKRMAFVTRRSGRWELWAKSLDDGRQTLLVAADGLARAVPRWSHDGGRLAYRRSRFTNPESDLSIVLLSAGGGDEQVLTSASLARETALDWSADGAWILGNSTRRTPGRTLICLFPIAAAPRAETQMRVVAADPEQSLFQARFSPDERWISFNAIKASDAGVSTIYVVPRSGGTWTRITEGKFWDDKARWSPDGKTIYYVSNRTGFFNVWGIRFDQKSGTPLGEPFRVTTFDSPGQMVLPRPALLELSLAANRMVLPIMEVSGGIWILTNVDR